MRARNPIGCLRGRNALFAAVGGIVSLSSLASVLAVTSCSGDNDDAIANACRVIVEGCGVGPSVGDCIDSLAAASQECLECIAEDGPFPDSPKCGYSSCMRLSSGCRIPPSLMGK